MLLHVRTHAFYSTRTDDHVVDAVALGQCLCHGSKKSHLRSRFIVYQACSHLPCSDVTQVGIASCDTVSMGRNHVTISFGEQLQGNNGHRRQLVARAVSHPRRQGGSIEQGMVVHVSLHRASGRPRRCSASHNHTTNMLMRMWVFVGER